MISNLPIAVRFGFLFLSMASLAVSLFILGSTMKQMVWIEREVARQKGFEDRLLTIESNIISNTDRITKTMIRKGIDPF